MPIGPNSKSFYVNQPAPNQYQLFWLPYKTPAPPDWDKIRRDKAISLATRERWLRRNEPWRAFKAYTHIRPGRWELDRIAGYITEEDIQKRLVTAQINGYIVEDKW